MKIVKRHKSRTKYSEQFGIWSGVTLANIPMGAHDHQTSFGGLQDKINHIKVGDNSNDAFIWFDDMNEARVLGQRLIDIANESDKRNNQ
jgi:hypothetical protein